AASIGSRSPHLHTGAVGKLLLAARDDQGVNRYLDTNSPLYRYTERTPTTPEQVWSELRAIRTTGYSVSDEEIAVGMYGIAAPIFDRRGALAAAITIAAPMSRSRPDERAVHQKVVVEAGRRISSNLGCRTTGGPAQIRM